MKIILLLFFIINLESATIEKNIDYKVYDFPKNMSTSVKKERFFYLLVPSIEKVYQELELQYQTTFINIKESKNLEKIKDLKKIYNAHSDEELLLRLKPHPKSIVLAQAIIESAWATSRFFREANNVFGIWSLNKNEPRIAAAEKREGIKTIWLRKFLSIEESIEAYYKVIARAKVYEEFRKLRMITKNPYRLVKKLDKYSEMGKLYGEELAKIIKYNKLIKYDK